MKTLTFLTLLLLAACSTRAQPTPTNAPPPPIVLQWGQDSVSGCSYNVYWGIQSSNYVNNVAVGTNLSYAVSNLLWGGTYYFNVTASRGNVTSAYTTELTWTITNPPPSVGGLTIK